MAKKFEIDDDDSLKFDPIAGAAKLPANITQGRTVRTDYLDVPINQIVPFQGKLEAKFDFSRSDPEKFEALVKSIRQDGVLDAILVRPWADGKFELLAGETRWMAAKEALQPTIPARVLRNCDEARAARIFSITNLARRDLTMYDKICGWWYYWENTKQQGRRNDLLKRDLEDLGEDVDSRLGEMSIRQIQRYHKAHSLVEPLFKRVCNKKINLKAGEFLAALKPEEQMEIAQERIDTKQARELKLMSEAGEWSREGIDAILHPNVKVSKPETNMRKAFRSFEKSAGKRIAPSYWDNMESILNEALELYLREHPEMETQI